MATATAWYLEERAKKLAIVYLTRRQDLTITETPETEYGYEFLVGVCQNGRYTGRVFGVQLKAALALQIKGQSNGHLQLDVGDWTPVPDVPFPLCLFVFAMQTDEAYYKWLKEPMLEENTLPKLKSNRSREFQRLTNTELEKIIRQVNLWYDHSFAGQ